VWLLFHQLRIFRNQGYKVIFARDEKVVIHRTCTLPGYFRFSFMKKNDLLISIWTHPGYRGNDLAQRALRKAMRLLGESGHRLWYVVRPANASSVAMAEKSGFVFTGQGRRTSFSGIKILGQFKMEGAETSSQWKEQPLEEISGLKESAYDPNKQTNF
jgi:RimJ/RimL family protein N-acetyltransferase